MSAHEGVSCDACGKSNFRSKQFKCLICYDYDLCSTCYEQGETSSHHTREHPMQCILTRQDFDLYYQGERCTSEYPQSLTCPFCGEMGLTLPFLNESSSSNDHHIENIDLFQHLQIKHGKTQQLYEVICPICAAMVNGEPNLVTADLISHITNDHQDPQGNTPSSAGGETHTYSRQSSSTRDYNFGIDSGIRAGFRRGSLRTTIRRGALGRGNEPVSQHILIDTSSGLPTSANGNDPITNLLTQLSNVRRLAAVNNNMSNTNSSLTSSPNTINIQTLTRQQYERERLRAAGRSYHYQQSNNPQQQSIPTSNVVPSVESDFFDSLYSSALLTDPSTLSTNNHQAWTRIITQQQSTPEQQSQTSSKTKTSTATNSESDPSLLRQMCDQSTSSSLIQSNSTVMQSSKKKNDFVQNLLLSSFAYLINDK
ncbi:unnamed protein product [Rotaria sp. Silwood1]|nr:unnamed protein product [Rotaria sp. Silwood1]CAF1506876.1 unnamed protein product [Rotaria sp. Silwood1]CAF1507816.1 unnamed protein product [Rotaria sp. Silwood1]CAF3681623.1 unnamed protein product [Rotaria sp. Silwood1]CAF4605950.1 unnamed protein product [Rotaria sp. Silwood1]